MSIGRRYFFSALFLVLFSALALPACAGLGGESEKRSVNDGCIKPSIGDVYGSYTITQIERISGGLTTDQQAHNYLGQSAEVSPLNFHVLDISIKQPSYRLACKKIFVGEGNVQSKQWLNFYGFGAKRKAIIVLQVFAPSSQSYPYEYELVSENRTLQIWNKEDGFFYRLRKSD